VCVSCGQLRSKTWVNVATLQCAAQEQLEEDLAKEGEEGDLNLDQNLLNEYSKLKETAMARASKPTHDCATQEAQLKASAPHTSFWLRRVMIQSCHEEIRSVKLLACQHELQQCCASSSGLQT
jgi:hypothetical protein